MAQISSSSTFSVNKDVNWLPDDNYSILLAVCVLLYVKLSGGTKSRRKKQIRISQLDGQSQIRQYFGHQGAAIETVK